VSGRHHTPICISYGGPILLLLLYFSLHQDKITPDTVGGFNLPTMLLTGDISRISEKNSFLSVSIVGYLTGLKVLILLKSIITGRNLYFAS